MFKSVFIKYISGFSLVILGSFLVLSTIITTMLGNFVREDQRKNVEWMADTTADFVAVAMEGKGTVDEFIISDYQKLKQVFTSTASRFEYTTIILTDTNGNILINTDVDATSGLGAVSESVMEKATEDSFMGLGTFGGMFKDERICHSAPIAYDSKTVGYAFVCTSFESQRNLMRSMEETVYMSSLWIMLASIITFYFICDRTVMPLRSMVSATKSYSTGDFSARVTVRGSDEIAELATAFNNMAEALEKNEKMRNTFIANISHDLRTPMTTISGFIDGIRSGAIPPEKRDYYIGVISEEVNRLSRLVSRLLDVSQLESGSKKYEFINFDICEMARLILISFERRIDEKRLEVEFDADADKMMVHADKDSIHQVIYNLIENAIKFSREGGVFRIRIRESGERKVIFSVYDEGRELSEEDAQFIFDRFYKADKSRGRDNNGVGLGLYICKTIIDAHGERLYVNSHEGACEFEFTLKRAVLERHATDVVKIPEDKDTHRKNGKK